MTSDNPEPNPYADALSQPEQDNTSNARDQSVHAEPWMRKTVFDGDPSAGNDAAQAGPPDVEHTVWDEPALSPRLAGDQPDAALTWARWYEQRKAQTSTADTWLITTLLVVVSAPLALVTAWFRFGGSTIDLLAFVVLIPATEELLKIAGALWVVEKKPWYFSSPLQILLCAGFAGLLFGFIRHVFGVELFDPERGVFAEPGGLAVSLIIHTLCSLIAGLGLVRIWSLAVAVPRQPDLSDGGIQGAVAIGIHVAWSIVIVVRQLSG